jgi:hypothetical protein
MSIIHASHRPHVLCYIQNLLATNLVIWVALAEPLAPTFVLQWHHDGAELQPIVPCSSCPALLLPQMMDQQSQLGPEYEEVCYVCTAINNTNIVVIMHHSYR